MADTRTGPPFFYKPGLHNVGSYQVSGRPWITGSDAHPANTEVQVKFPSVAKSFTVMNLTSSGLASQELYIHFAPGSSGTETIANKHYVPLEEHQDSYTFNVKCSSVYISTPSTNGAIAKWRIIAELTNIPCSEMGNMRGCGLTEAGAALGQDPNTRIVITDDS